MEKQVSKSRAARFGWRPLLKLGWMVLGVYGVVLGLLYVFQGDLLYPGHRMYQGQRLEDPKTQELLAELSSRPWLDEKGEYRGFCREPEGAQEAWLIFYGNGDHAVRGLHYFSAIQANLPGRNPALYVMEYPGYGPRPGTPNQELIVRAGREAFEAVQARYSKVFLLGQSLGAGVACQITGLFPDKVEGLFLLTPFDRMETSARARMAGWFGPAALAFPTGLLLRDSYNSLEALQAYHGPLAVIAGGCDTLTPASGAKRLVEQAGLQGRLWVQESNGHWADLSPEPRCRELFAFVTAPALEEKEP